MLFLPAAALMGQQMKAYNDGHLEEKLMQLGKPKLLVIDELGYLPFEPAVATAGLSGKFLPLRTGNSGQGFCQCDTIATHGSQPEITPVIAPHREHESARPRASGHEKTRRALRRAGFNRIQSGGRYWVRTSDPCRVKAFQPLLEATKFLVNQ